MCGKKTLKNCNLQYFTGQNNDEKACCICSVYKFNYFTVDLAAGLQTLMYRGEKAHRFHGSNRRQCKDGSGKVN